MSDDHSRHATGRVQHDPGRPLTLTRRYTDFFLLGLCLVGLGCSSPPSGATAEARTLMGGGLALTFEDFGEPADTLILDLQIGLDDGSPDTPTHAVFGDIRGLEVDEAGNIYVLDYQADELRKFDGEGRYLGTLMGPGAGPGEIGRAFGMRFDVDGNLWVMDVDNRRVTVLSQDGEVLRELEWRVGRWGVTWRGAPVENRYWDFGSDLDREALEASLQAARRIPGVSRGFSIDIAQGFGESEAADTQFVLGPFSYTGIRYPRGSSSVPYMPRPHMVVTPLGHVWDARPPGYSFTKRDMRGDTLVWVTANVPEVPIPAGARQRTIASMEETMERLGRVEIDWTILPHTFPPLVDVFPDDIGGAWIQRHASEGFVVDRFDSSGRHLGSASLGTGASPIPGLVRRGRLYLVGMTTQGVPAVFRFHLERRRGATRAGDE